MFKFTSFLTIVLVLAVSLQFAAAVPAFTSPVASTTGQGGQKLKLRWQDNNKSPKYDDKDWGNSTIFLAVGSQNTQFKLQTLASNVSPHRHGGSYTIDKSVGPSGKYYFIRMEGSEKDSSGNPVMAFSARFELKGMSGQFNSTVLSAASGTDGPSSSGSSGSSASSSSAAGGMQTAVNQATQTASSPTAQQTNNTATNTKASSAGRLSSVNAASLVVSLALTAVGVVALV